MSLPECYRNPGGYTVGPTLAAGARPWPVTWETDRTYEQCEAAGLHQWETVLLHGSRRRVEEVVRCAKCHTPRCGHAGDDDPCMLRRHHRQDHVTLHGSRRTVGV